MTLGLFELIVALAFLLLGFASADSLWFWFLAVTAAGLGAKGLVRIWKGGKR